MKRAFWFDGAYMDQQIAETDITGSRARDEVYIVQEFMKAFHDSPRYAVKWLFFARAVLSYVPEYGRYDDVLVLLDTPLAGDVAAMYQKQTCYMTKLLKDMIGTGEPNIWKKYF